jgi:hypothetical protein
VVNDAGREFRGRAAIRSWSDRDIFEALVTLEIVSVSERGDKAVVTTQVDGNCDRTGLPDPVMIDHEFMIAHEQIVALTCRPAGEKVGD